MKPAINFTVDERVLLLTFAEGILGGVVWNPEILLFEEDITKLKVSFSLKERLILEGLIKKLGGKNAQA